MKDRIGFIAVGQAGGNIGTKLESKGYPVLYINTSEEDLSTLGNSKFKHHIKGGEGCNKDRKKAKQALADDFDEVSRKIKEGLETEFIYLIFSSGGGTGSGAGPMLADLILEDIADGILKTKNVGIITILPALKETVKANINSYECFMELNEIEGLAGTFVLDNELTSDKFVLNTQFVRTFTEFLDIPNRYKSERGNIDKAEIMETLKAGGMNYLAQLSAKESRMENVIEKLRRGMFAEDEHDGIVKYITVSQSGSFDIDVLQREMGIPVDIFQTYNEHTTIVCLSGLTFPATRLERTYQMIEDNKEKVLKNVTATRQIKMQSGIDFLQEAARSNPVRKKRNIAQESESEPQKKSRRELMKKYI